MKKLLSILGVFCLLGGLVMMSQVSAEEEQASNVLIAQENQPETFEEKISGISNHTIKDYLIYFHESGYSPKDYFLFENFDLEDRIVVIGETPKGKAPIIGFSESGENGIVGSLSVNGVVTTYSSADPEQSATIGELIQAWEECQEQ